ncbi:MULTISPECIES: flagellar hook-length control protein FliK [Methylotenera]|uniref:flagellar hook-length control protein FliK n=1 Tax=Methylotenera TaxID=359407 RepID=UPI00035D5530|nr:MULTISPECIES: flagellar hook-length control protein FliK [Methylotenera]
MAFITANPLQTVKQNQSQVVITTSESNAEAFQKVLEKQLNHAELQKKRDEVVKPAGDKTHKNLSTNPSTPEIQDDKAKLPLAHTAKSAHQKITRTQHNGDKKTVLNEKPYTDNKLRNNENLKDKVDLLGGFLTGENSGQSVSLINSAAQDQAIASDVNHELQHPKESAIVTNPLLPMLNMIHINSTIQSKLDKSAPVLDNGSDEIKNSGLIDAKFSELPIDEKWAKKNPLDVVADVETPDDHENRQMGISQSFTESLNQQSNFHDESEVKLTNQFSSLQVSANLPTTAPVVVTATNSAQPVISYDIAPKLGGSDWNEAISKRIIWMVGTEQQSATLTLNPPDLGPLQVVIQVHNQQADTTFISQNPEVRQALQDGLDNLRDMMTNSGIQLGQANVHSDNQAQQHSQRSTQSALGPIATSDDAQSTVTNTTSRIFVSNGLVDTFA